MKFVVQRARNPLGPRTPTFIFASLYPEQHPTVEYVEVRTPAEVAEAITALAALYGVFCGVLPPVSGVVFYLVPCVIL